ncbi:hypothetical protein BH09PLA1_BH09PLA1_05820 [soil metagenome]
MNLDYAVDRLYESGWSPVFGPEQYESLPDGRRFPGMESIYREFEHAGLKLSIKHNLVFDTHRATWSPASQPSGAAPEQNPQQYGTVIGSSDREAAVYALAQLRESHVPIQLALA